MTMKKVSGDLAKNRDYLDRQLGVGESFDVLYRNVEIGKKNAALYMIDGFCKDEVMQKLLQHFIGITKEQMPEDAALNNLETFMAYSGGRGRDEQAACALWRG